MNRSTHAKKISDRLHAVSEAGPPPEPPTELRGALLREVPERLELAPEIEAGASLHGGSRSSRWVLAAAASLLVAVGAGLVAVRVMEERPDESMPGGAAESIRTVGGEPSARAPAEPEAVPGPLPETPPGRTPEADERIDPADPGAGSRSARAEAPGVRESSPETSRRLETGAAAGQASRSGEDEAEEDLLTVTSESPLLDERSNVEATPRVASPAYETFERLRAAQAEPPPAENLSVSTEPEPGVNYQYSPMREEARRLEAELAKIEASSAEREEARRITRPAAPAMVPPSVLPPSTGGTGEPNDQPYGDVFFQGYGTNPFLDPAEDPLSTFALDVDTGSYTVVRRYLRDGHRPPPDAVRVEEMVNAFEYGDRAPAEGDFGLIAQGARSPFASGPRADSYHLLRLAVRARDVAAAERKPAVLVFVVDVSGSMAAENRLGLVKRSLGLLLGELRPDDRVGLVVYGSRGRVVLEPTGDHAAIERAIAGLRTEGATNAEEGIVLGYEMARRHFREGAIHRLILCSDGVANVGRTGHGSILERVGDEARRGIELTTVGFGMGNYNDVLMEQLADQGDGAYAYVDRLDEARRVFVENLSGTLQTVARDAKVQVELNHEVVERYRLIGYENRDVPDELFRDDSIDAGEIGAGHTATALYELRLRPDAPARATAAVFRLRYRSADTGEVVEVERPVAVRELRGSWERAPVSLRLASVVAELAEVLRGSYWARDADLDDLFRRAQRVAADFPGNLRVAELATMIGRLAEMDE